MNNLFGITGDSIEDGTPSPEEMRLILYDILISYVQNNKNIKEKQKYLDKIRNFFPENKKCEKNVRNSKEKENPKIIQFPKRA